MCYYSCDMRVLVSAGEVSGDLHGSRLVEALEAKIGPIDLYSLGGKRLAKLGAKTLYPLAEQGIMGFAEVLKNWNHLRAARKAVSDFLRTTPPDVLIPIDYPGFNIRLCRSAGKMGIPVVYYISPQVWAWHRSRIKTIGRVVNKILVIFPFEKPLYEEAGVPVEFVGHPLLDALADLPNEDDHYDGVTIGILPGSRMIEMEHHLFPMVDAAKILREKTPHVRFFLPVADGIDPSTLLEALDRKCGVRIDEAVVDEDPEIRLAHGPFPVGIAESDLEILLVRDPNYTFRQKMDFAMTASGTATLENAILGIPMVIVYRTSRLTFEIAKRLVKVKNVGLVNLVAERRICPELIQNDVRGDRIAEESLRILGSSDLYAQMKEDLHEVKERLGSPGASENAAEAVLSVLSPKSPVISL